MADEARLGSKPAAEWLELYREVAAEQAALFVLYDPRKGNIIGVERVKLEDDTEADATAQQLIDSYAQELGGRNVALLRVNPLVAQDLVDTVTGGR